MYLILKETHPSSFWKWFKLACLLAILFATTAAFGASSAQLNWQRSTDPAVAGYKVYRGVSTRQYSSITDAGTNNSLTVLGLTAGQTYYFAVTAYTGAGIESAPSSEVIFTVPLQSSTNRPSISVVTPNSAPPGAQVLVYGAALGGSAGVQFGGVTAGFAIASDTLLTITVPTTASSGPLTINTPAGSTSAPFTILPAPPAIPPSNDNFANALPLSGTAAVASANTLAATKESGEPNHTGNAGGHSVWYRWTAPSAGAWSLDSSGTAFTALLAVYTGNSLGSLSLVTSNKSSGALSSGLSFNAVKNTTYQIAVDGLDGASGDVVLRLAPVISSTLIFSSTFEAVNGYNSLSSLNGQNGWISTVPGACGLVESIMAGYGQQACIGAPLVTISGSPVLLYHPLNYTVDTNSRPIIHFSTAMQLYNSANISQDLFGWAVRNAAGHEFFRLTFDNSSKTIGCRLDNGAGVQPTGTAYDYGVNYILDVVMDFSRNRWSASWNGAALVSGQPITSSGAALTLGDIDALAVLQNLFQGLDGMLFDNCVITAEPSPNPKITQGPASQTVAAGTDVVLSVAATGTPLSYQWSHNNTAVPGGSKASLTLKNAVSTQSGSYTVVVFNSSGSASSTALVTITNQPPAAALVKPAVSAGAALINISLTSGNNYRLQASSNLIDWVTLNSFLAQGTNAVCSDPATNFNRRFYRVVSP